MKRDKGGFLRGSGRAAVTQSWATPTAPRGPVTADDRAQACGDRTSLASLFTQFPAACGRAWGVGGGGQDLSSATAEAHVLLCWRHGAASSRTPTVTFSPAPRWAKNSHHSTAFLLLFTKFLIFKHIRQVFENTAGDNVQTAKWPSWKRAPRGEVSGGSPRSGVFLPAARFFSSSLKWGCWPLRGP